MVSHNATTRGASSCTLRLNVLLCIESPQQATGSRRTYDDFIIKLRALDMLVEIGIYTKGIRHQVHPGTYLFSSLT